MLTLRRLNKTIIKTVFFVLVFCMVFSGLPVSLLSDLARDSKVVDQLYLSMKSSKLVDNFGLPAAAANVDSSQLEYQLSLGPVNGSAAIGYVYATLFNPVGSGRSAVIKKIGIQSNSVAAAVFQTLSLRRISAASGGTQLASANIPKKNTDSSSSILEARYANVTVTYAQATTSRLTAVVAPGAAGSPIGNKLIDFESDEKLVLQPGEGVALYQETAGDTDNRIRLIAEWEEQASAPSAQNEFMMAWTRVEVAATANYAYHTFLNPSGSGKTAVVKRMSIDVACDGAAVYTNNIGIIRITSASGGTQIPTADAPKKNTSSGDSAMVFRTAGPSIVAAQASTSRLTMITPCAAASQDIGRFDIRFAANDEKVVVKEGEGLALFTDAAGDADQITMMALEWAEETVAPAAAGEYVFTYPRVELAATAGQKYHTFFNPAASGVNAVVKRLYIAVDADNTATSQPISIRRINSASGGTAMSAANIPKKNTATGNTAMDLRYNNVTANLTGSGINARILSVTGPTAVGQLHSRKEAHFGDNEKLVLRPGDGIALYSETAGDVDHYVKLTVEWDEEASAPSSNNEYMTAIGPVGGSATPGYVDASFFNPASSTKTAIIKRLSLRINSVAAATSVPFSIMRITAASGATQVAAADIPTKNTSTPNSSVEVRFANPTVSYVSNQERLYGVTAPGAVGSAAAPALSGYLDREFSNQEGLVLLPGEGIALRQETAGFTGHRVFLDVEWQESNSPPASQGEFAFSTNEVAGSTSVNYVYGLLYNPPTSGKNFSVTRMEARVHATTTATYVSATVRRISTTSAGSLITAANIAPKNSSSTVSSAEIRTTGASATLSGAAESRLMGVTTPGASNQISGLLESAVTYGDELILKPGEGIALFQEAAGDTDHRVFFNFQWSESAVASGITVSGSILQNDGQTLYNCSGGNLTISVKVNGLGSNTGTCISGNSYSVSGLTFGSAGDVITIYISAGGQTGAVVTRAADTSSNISANIYINSLILRHEDAGPITIANLDSFDSEQNSSVPFLATTSPSTNLTVADGTRLIVWNSKTFTPGGSITTSPASSASSSDGDLQIMAGAALNMAGHDLSLGGDMINAGTLSLNAGQTTTLTATGNGFALGTSFQNLVFNGSGGGWSTTSAVTVAGDVTMTAGTLSGSNNITVSGGDVTGAGVINMTGGTFLLDGTGSFGSSAGWTFSGLTFGDGSGNATTTAVSSASTTASSSLVIAAAQTLDAGTGSWNLIGSGSPLSAAGVFMASSSTVSYRAVSGTSTPLSTNYFNLAFAPASGNPVFALPATSTVAGSLVISGPATVNAFANNASTSIAGNMTIGSGSTYVAATGVPLTLAGNFVNSGTFTHSNGSTVFNASATSTVNTGSSGLFNLNKIGNGVLLSQSTTSVAGALTVSAGTFNAGSSTVVLSGTGTPLLVSGSFLSASSTVVYQASGNASVTPLTYNILKIAPTSGNPVYGFNSSAVPLVVQNNFEIGGGQAMTLNANASVNLNLYGNLTIATNAVFNKATSTIYFSGGRVQTWTDNSSSKQDLGAVSVSSSSPGTVLRLGSAVKLTSLTVAAGHQISLGANILTLTGTGTPLTVLGTLNPGTGTVGFAATGGTVDVPTLAYYNLDFSPVSGSATFNLPSSAGGVSWYNSAWPYRKVITVDNGQVSGNDALSDFPLLISFTDPALAMSSRGGREDGRDIVFTSSNGTTKLSHEIEKYNSLTGELIAWVKLPSLATSAPTSVYMYYGNPNAADQQAVSGVWNHNGYFGVWHSNQTEGLSVTDSSGLSHTATRLNAGEPGNVQGYIGNALAYDGSNDRISAGDLNDMDGVSKFSYSSWIKPLANVDSDTVMAKFFSSTSKVVLSMGAAGVGDNTSWVGYVGNGDNTLGLTSTGLATAGAWQHLAMTYDGSGLTNSDRLKIYLNGQEQALTFSGTIPATLASNTGNFVVGAAVVGGNNAINADIDEIRVATSTLTAARILTEYRNQSATSTFYAIGGEEQQGLFAIANNLSLAGAGNPTVTMAANNPNVAVMGSVSIGSGTTLTASASGTFTVRGNFSNSGTFSANSGTLTLNPAGSAVQINGSSATTFHNLTANAPGKTLSFGTAAVYTVSGNLNLSGQAGKVLGVNSTNAGSQWTLKLTGAANVSNLFIADSGCDPASKSIQLDDSAVSGGNNGPCWLFINRGGGAANNFAPGDGSGGGGSVGGGSGGSGGGSTDGGGGSSGGAITAVSSATATPGDQVNSISWSHNVSSASDRLLFVVSGGGDNSSVSCRAASVTYNGTSMTRAWTVYDGTWNANEGWYLVNPAVGNNTILVSYAGGGDPCLQAIGGSTLFSGVNQSSPIGTAATSTGSSANPSVTVSSGSGQLVIAGLSSDAESGITQAGTILWELEGVSSDTSFGAQYYSGAASVNATWTQANTNWSTGGVSINPSAVVSGGGGSGGGGDASP